MTQRHPVVAVLVGLALLVLIALLPDLSRSTATGDAPIEAYHGRIESITPGAGGSEPDPGLPPVTTASVQLLEGPRAGDVVEAYLVGPGGAQSVADYRPGDDVVVTISATPDDEVPFIAVSDRWRLPMVVIVILIFAAAVVVVGGWHGVRALVALGLTIGIIVKVLLPLLIAGYPPVPLAVVTATGVTIVAVVLTEGWKRSSVAAILGTAGALAITALLAAAATTALGFTYIAGSDLAFFTLPDGTGLDLRGVLLASIILGAVGVLDDVTVTQATLVDQLAEAGGLEGPPLVVRAMAVGRSHIAATVNTLFLAYVGAGLPLLVVLLVSRQPSTLVFNDEVIVTEVVRTLVGSLGIVAAIPLTTFIASALRSSSRPGRATSRSTMVAAGIIGLLLLMTAILPLTSGPRAPLTPDRLDPSAIPSGSAPDQSPGPTDPADGSVTIVEIGEEVPITIDGAVIGTVAVESWASAPSGDGSIEVEVRYRATAAFPIASGSWALLFSDGSEIVLLPTDLAILDRTLPPGERLDVILIAEGLPPEEPSLVYVDAATGLILFGALLGS